MPVYVFDWNMILRAYYGKGHVFDDKQLEHDLKTTCEISFSSVLILLLFSMYTVHAQSYHIKPPYISNLCIIDLCLLFQLTVEN